MRVTVALIQMHVEQDMGENITRARGLIRSADAEIIVLPEMFCCPYDNASFVKNAIPADGAVCTMLSETARETGRVIVGGSYPELSEGRIYNTSPVFDGGGKCIASHRKAHLFDIDIEGGQRFCESDTLTAGSAATVFDTDFGRFGLAVCFDIRFPELFRRMAEMGAVAVFVPAAFNMTTGPLHWELLFRARAVDYQLFTLGCAPARGMGASYVSYANSIVVSPWGSVLARADADERTLYCTLDLDDVAEARRQIPLAHAMRWDIYRGR